MALADRAELAVRLTLDDRSFTGPLRRVQGNLGRLDRATSNTQRALGRTGAALQRTAVIAAAAAATGFVAVVRAAGDFQDAFAGIEKTVDAPTARLDELRAQIRAMALEIPVAATELARIGETAGALGIDVDFIDEFIETVAKLGVTTNLSSDEAADALGRISTILGFTGTDIQTFASALVALGNKGASTEAEIIEITKRFSAQGQQAGLSTAEILAFSSSISSLGVEVEAGGTALSKAFARIITETALASDEGKKFAEVAGIAFTDFSKIVKNDTGKAVLLFLKGLGKLDKFSQQIALEDIGITGVRERNAILLFAQNTEFLTEQLGIANEAIKDTSAIDTEAAKKFATFNSQIQKTKNILTDVGITIGNKLLPKIQPLLTRLGQFVSENQPAIERFGDAIAGAFDDLAAAAVRIPWGAIKDGLGATAALAKAAFEAFTKAPAWLQTLLIGGFAVNKATGGLLTGITQDLGGAIFGKITTGSFFERGSSPAVPMYVSAVGGLGGGVGPGGGGLLNGLKVLGAVTLAGTAITLLTEIRDSQIGGFKDQTDTITGDIANQIVGGGTIADLEKSRRAILEGLDQLGAGPDASVPDKVRGFILGLAGADGAVVSLTEQLKVLDAAIAAIGAPPVPLGPPAPSPKTGGLSPDERQEHQDAQIIAASQARTAFEAKANAAQIRMAIDRARHAILTNKADVTVSTTVNVSTKVAAGGASSAISTYQTYRSGRAINTLGYGVE